MAKDTKKDREGYFPDTGTITAEEIAERLRRSSVPNVKEALEKKGIKYKEIVGVRLYRCEDLGKLFWEE